MSTKRYLEASLRPPALKVGDVCAVEEALVDASAYIVDERNNTTALTHNRDGVEMQVSLFLAQPPRVSYFCVSCTNNQPTELCSEPKLVATEGNLALSLLMHGRYSYKHDYYVYRAPVAVDGVLPMLDKVRHPEPGLFLGDDSCYFHDYAVGLLRYRASANPPDGILTLRRHKSRDDLDAYKIAALCTDDLEPQMSRCNLYTYDSRSKTWDRKAAVLADQQYEAQLATHHCLKVINIGGDAGTMGWVDLEKGIILCDVLGACKEDSCLIRYIPLPDDGPVRKINVLRGTTRRYRTVAAVHGRIEYVEVQIHFRPGPRPTRLHGTYFSAGWTIVRWSTTAEAGSSGWRKDSQLSSSDITVPADMAALLPTLPKDIDEDATTLERLHVGHPTISLGDDSGIVYFMAKVDEMEEQAWVIAVNTKKKVLQGVTEFAPRSRYSMEFTFMPTTISKYLIPGTKGNMKRPGMLLQGSSQKKLLPTQPSHGSSFGQNVHNAQVEQEDDGIDNMDLE